MPPELNLKRAVFVLGKIDEILAWDKGRLHERDLRFVDLGRYLCEVRAGQYWRSAAISCGALLAPGSLSWNRLLARRDRQQLRSAISNSKVHDNAVGKTHLPSPCSHSMPRVSCSNCSYLTP
jgi:hypothetical protein